MSKIVINNEIFTKWKQNEIKMLKNGELTEMTNLELNEHWKKLRDEKSNAENEIWKRSHAGKINLREWG